MLDGKHDPPPNGGGINNLLALLHGVENIVRGFGRFNGKWSCALRGFQHFGLQETWLHSQHIHAVAGKPITQASK